MRYLPHTTEDIAEMLAAIGLSSLEDLFSSVPPSCRTQQGLALPEPLSEWQLNAHMDKLAGSIAVSPEYKIFMGGGSYNHQIPASVQYLLSRSEFATAYTPYQPEMSQGSLQAVYEFQTLCCRLVGMDIATASHYDGATALAEAVLIAIRKTNRQKIAISKLVHPHYRQVLASYLRPMACEIIELPWTKEGKSDLTFLANASELAAIVIQSPNFLGVIEELDRFAALAQKSGALSIVSFTEPLAYGLLKNPGSQGADLVAGEGQSLGVPQSFGGPGLGIIACRQKYMRNLPGRLVGETVDLNGERGFVLTLATREQHIRRAKASSNICSNNGLCAIAAAMYLASLGGTGFKKLAEINRNKSQYLKERLNDAGVNLLFSGETFNEFVVDLGAGFSQRYKELCKKKIVAGLPLAPFYPELSHCYLLCVTETASRDDLDLLVKEVCA